MHTRTTMVALGLVVALLFIWFARHVLLLLFGGVLFAVFLTRLSGYVARLTRLPRGVSLAVTVSAIVGLFVLAFWLRGSQIAQQATELSSELPRALQSLQQRLSNQAWAQWLIEQLPLDRVMSQLSGAWSQIAGALSGFLGALVSMFFIVYFTLALAATPGVYRRGVLQLVPSSRQDVVCGLLDEVSDVLWWWLLGRLMSMAFVGVATWLGLMLLGVPLAFMLALLAALLSFVPNIGPVLSALPAMILAGVQQPQLALYVGALFVGVQVIDNYLLTPIIDRKTVYLPPALTIFSQLVLGVFTGLIGVAFAAPLVAAAMVLVQTVYVRGVLRA